MKIDRLFEIVYLLMNHKGMTANMLAERFGVSVRTIYRDIEALSLAGIPVYSTQGKGGGVAILDHFTLDKTWVTESDQENILLALQSLQATGVPDVKEPLQRIQSLFNRRNLDWLEIDFSPWHYFDQERERFNQLKQAIWDHQLIQFEYLNARSEVTARTVEPLKLVNKAIAWYLYGYCHTRQAMRFFKLSRIRQLTVTDERFSPREVGPLFPDTLLGATSEMMQLVLKFDASSRFKAFDNFHGEIIEQSDGSFLVKTAFPKEEWVIEYLLSFGEHLEVLEPLDLRAELIRRINLLQTVYKPDKQLSSFTQ